MSLTRIFIIAFISVSLSAVNAQVINRGDLCLSIPDLTAQQKSAIETLQEQHQQKMDDLRLQFYSETDVTLARDYKSQMTTEQNNHYKAIQELLTADQLIWFNQNCLRSTGRAYLQGQGIGRSQGIGRGQGRGQGQGIGRGQGVGRGLRY